MAGAVMRGSMENSANMAAAQGSIDEFDTLHRNIWASALSLDGLDWGGFQYGLGSATRLKFERWRAQV
jgi:hypothetical protein